MIECTRGGVDLRVPPSMPPDEVWRYGIGVPVQVAPRTAAVFCNIRRDYTPTWDYEAGADVILFDDLSHINVDAAIPISRNEEGVDPDTGDPSALAKYPVIGGFVPQCARRADGSPHPHAGTGFGVCQVVHFNTVTEKWAKPARNEWHQFAYDEDGFRVLKVEHVPARYIPGLTTAIPDGDDLLYAMSTPDGGSGVTRWRREADGWRLSSFSAVQGAERTSEPSLIRDTDGSLLLGARGGNDSVLAERNRARSHAFNIRVWRSEDGKNWTQVVHAERLIAGSPVTLNQAADGTPYVAGNLHQEFFEDSMGVYSHGREILCLWPLNADRTGVEPGLVARACRAEFAAPPSNTYWLVDHPSATTLRLADGRWHNVLACRIMELSENALCWCFNGLGNPPPQTGCYLEEVFSSGEARPLWKF